MNLQEAIESLGAIEVAPGAYARFDTSDDRWCVGTIDEAGSWGTKRWMPYWWSPERRFAWRVYDGKGSQTFGPWTESALAKRFDSEEGLLGELNAYDGDYERITADLETGAEVSA